VKSYKQKREAISFPLFSLVAGAGFETTNIGKYLALGTWCEHDSTEADEASAEL